MPAYLDDSLIVFPLFTFVAAAASVRACGNHGNPV